MRNRTTLICPLLALALWFLFSAAGAATDTVTMTLPRGDAEAGRAAFLKLSCTSCHLVAGEPDLPKPVSANRGPTLGAYQSERGEQHLALSIFAPSHEISATIRQEREDGLSPMADFTNAMTVREFIDIVEFLRSQK